MDISKEFKINMAAMFTQKEVFKKDVSLISPNIFIFPSINYPDFWHHEDKWTAMCDTLKSSFNTYSII